MQPRAFVIMPFGTKPPESQVGHPLPAGTAEQINFDAIFYCLLEPALQRAGFDVARADSASNAGDIRTDMFFELVTADLVIADISILNANVYYELGIRHGVCPRGVFIVGANDAGSAPFDVAPDRRFTYDSSLFKVPGDDHVTVNANVVDCDKLLAVVDRDKLHAEVSRLAKTFKDASTLDQQTTGSPLYAHLPGLKPVEWYDIDTSKTKYFNALHSDWMDCVGAAQEKGRPGDIVTLARNAPTRLHEARILYEAAKALLNLCRYGAAKDMLADVIRLDPDHKQAKLDLALVTASLGETRAAEQYLKRILDEHGDDPQAADLLGQVFRYLWRLSWKDATDTATQRTKALDASQLAVSAIRSFLRAHQSDPQAYFAGFNALMLAFVLGKLGLSEAEMGFGRPPLAASEHRKIVTQLVRYMAVCERHEAIEERDYERQFWCTTTLAGLLLIEGKEKKAIPKVHEACAIPAVTAFQLQTFRDRLQLVLDLDICPAFLHDAIQIVTDTLKLKLNLRGCAHVILWHGHSVDGDRRKEPRFPRDRVDDLANEIERALKAWDPHTTNLAICGGMTESDIVFAQKCVAMGLPVRIMMRDPVPSEREQVVLWPAFASLDWHVQLQQLREAGDAELWIDTEQLGPVVTSDENAAEISIQRHRQWLINTAFMEASQTFKPDDNSSDAIHPKLHGLFLWDGVRAPRDPDDSSVFVREVQKFNRYQGDVRILSLQNAQAVQEIV